MLAARANLLGYFLQKPGDVGQHRIGGPGCLGMIQPREALFELRLRTSLDIYDHSTNKIKKYAPLYIITTGRDSWAPSQV